VSALVANDGSLATFDNWHSMGYGDDVIAIYRRDGSLVRKFALSDLMSEDDILWLSRSVSSIWWSGKHRIDNIAHALVIGVDGPTSTEIPISLSSGALLVPKRPLFKQFTVNWGAEEPGSSRCRNGEWTFSAEELAKLAIGACNPDYPRVARNARITGTVLLEFATDAAGKITDITILKPLAFGLDHAARDAFATWRFHPLVRNGTPVSGCGRVKFVFGSWPR
jgi:TonB family protein